MSFHANYYAEISHPVTEETVEARLSFWHTKYFAGSWEEPPDSGGVDIEEVIVFGEDITKLFSPSQLESLESEIWEAECESHEPDEDSFDSSYDDDMF